LPVLDRPKGSSWRRQMLCEAGRNFRSHAVVHYSAVVMISVWAVAFRIPTFESCCCGYANSRNAPIMGVARPPKRSGSIGQAPTASLAMTVDLGPMTRPWTDPQRRLGWDCYERQLPPKVPLTTQYTILWKQSLPVASCRRAASITFRVDAMGWRRSGRVSSSDI
jgi:hypothetical protein